MQNTIKISGAREHNLKNINLEIPRDKLVVITGLSGSGKSSLAFDTIYAEGQRRYVESLSAYARQFLGIMEKPDVDYIEGLSPAISIDQKSASKNPRSTVGTITEIYDYLRLLFARIGRPHCPSCGKEIKSQTPSQIIDQIKNLKSQTSNLKSPKIIILAPIISDQKGEHKKVFEEIKKAGFVRVRIDKKIYDLSEVPDLDKNKKHTIEIVVDRLILVPDLDRKRLSDSIETALDLGDGIIEVSDIDTKKETIFSVHFACPDCQISLPEIQPRIFSFNSPHGACSDCQGLGTKLEVDPDLIIPNKNLTLAEGAIRPWAKTSHLTWYTRILEEVAKEHNFSVDAPVSELSKKDLNIVFYGTGDQVYWVRKGGPGVVKEFVTTFEGVIPNLGRRYRETDSDFIRAEIKKYMIERICPTCQGKRLKPESLAIKIAQKSIIDVSQMTISKLSDFMANLAKKISKKEKKIAKQILKEIIARLKFLENVGLTYLTLNRAAATLAGGEAQRIRLATQIGSGLVGVVYILDEPSIGLHQRDIHRLLDTLKKLRDLGNTVLVVEHDQSTILAGDHIIDIGPGAGELGGKIVAQGTVKAILKNKNSITGQYLVGKKQIPFPAFRKKPADKFLTIEKAAEFNLKDITVKIPLGLFVCITGVSGSGKSTLVSEILAKALSAKFHRAKVMAGKHKKISGTEFLDKVINIDQSPIGRTPRSNPATYSGLFTPTRELFAQTPEAKIRGYKAGRFSFNVKGGRCETCKGEGQLKIEMHFLPDVWITCDECKGKRYNKEALEVHYKEKNISEILEMTVDVALEFFENIPAIKSKLEILNDVGLGYIHLGQPAPTLSGGEAQRVKLATELSRKATGKTLYILDEPTTGLHFDDIKKLLKVLNRLSDMGNTVLVIEHNMDVVKSADWIIDLGPEGGDKGGFLVTEGSPEKVAKVKKSYTGYYLKKALK
ncbi:UvrABC system protein A [subsurface metagenome]